MRRMTSIKPLLENDFVAHHGIRTTLVADVLSAESRQFDLDDMPSSVQLMEHGKGKVSLTNDVHGAVEILAYENFVNQCAKPKSFLNGRRKCDYMLVHYADKGYALLIELTSALGTSENLKIPINRYPGGKYEKCEYQLACSLGDLLAVPTINTCLLAKAHRVCLMAYRVNPHTDPDYLMKHPFERYLRVESKVTAEDGAIVPCLAINDMGFEYRRISHDYSFRLA